MGQIIITISKEVKKMITSNYIKHVTEDTGHVRRSYKKEVWDGTIETLTPILENALLSQDKALIHTTDYWVSCHEIFEDFGGEIGVVASEKFTPIISYLFMLGEPSVLRVSILEAASLFPSSILEMGDLERSVAWTLIEIVNKRELDYLSKTQELYAEPFIKSRVIAWGKIGNNFSGNIEEHARELAKLKWGKVIENNLTNKDVLKRVNFDMEVIMLNINMGDNPTINIITPDASRLIKNTGLKVNIDQHLDILKTPIFLMARNGFLYDNVKELAIFYLKESMKFHIIQTIYIDRTQVVQAIFLTNSAILGIAKDLQIDEFNKQEVESLGKEIIVEQVVSAGKETLTYVLKFLLLLNSEKTPIEKKETDGMGKRLSGKYKVSPSYQSISLTTKYLAKRKELEVARGELNKDGKILSLVEVSGFIKEQAYGENRSLRKTIYVDGYESHRWKKDGVKTINIKG